MVPCIHLHLMITNTSIMSTVMYIFFLASWRRLSTLAWKWEVVHSWWDIVVMISFKVRKLTYEATWTNYWLIFIFSWLACVALYGRPSIVLVRSGIFCYSVFMHKTSSVKHLKRRSVWISPLLQRSASLFVLSPKKMKLIRSSESGVVYYQKQMVFSCKLISSAAIV